MKKHYVTTAVAAAFALLATTAPLAGAQTATYFCDGEEATIVGTSGDDNIFGTDGDDVIVALGGHDKVFAGNGDDRICGGSGSDLLFGNLGADIIYGNNGHDLIAGNWDTQGSPVPQELLEDTGRLIAYGGNGSDTIIGTNRADDLNGGRGNDRVLGYDGADDLNGGRGNDIVVGHNGRDTILGGNGLDIISADRIDPVVRAGAGFDHCASVTNTATTHRSCDGTYITNASDPLLPAQALPRELAGGTENVYVHYGRDGDRNSVLFLVDDGAELMVAGADFELEPLADADVNLREAIHLQPVTPGEALAIGTAFLERRDFPRLAKPIATNESHYDDSVEWGLRWIELNTDE